MFPLNRLRYSIAFCLPESGRERRDVYAELPCRPKAGDSYVTARYSPLSKGPDPALRSFYRLIEQAVVTPPVPYRELVTGERGRNHQM